MDELKVWRELVGGNSEELVLAIDFDATGRPEARFSDLAARLGPDVTVWETLPQGVEAGASGATYVDRWAEEIRASGRTVRAVFGFCAGAAYAPALVERIGQWQDRPRMLLFDPETISGITMYRQFAKVMELVAGSLTADEQDRAQEAGRQAQQGTDDPTRLAAELLDIFSRFGRIAFPRLGLDSRRGDELVDTFTAFVDYLAAAAGFEPIPEWKQAIVIGSASPASGLNGLRSLDPDLGDVADREIRFELGHAQLLSSDEVADTVKFLLA